jgi:hypothetical protein
MMNLRAGVFAIIALLFEKVALGFAYPDWLLFSASIGTIGWPMIRERRGARPPTARERAISIPLLLLSAVAMWWIGAYLERHDPLHQAIPFCALLSVLLSCLAIYQVIALGWDLIAAFRASQAAVPPTNDSPL